MKKTSIILTSAIICLALITGFNLYDKAHAQQARTALSLGTPTSGSPPNILGTAMASIWRKYGNISVSVEPVGGVDAVVRATRLGKIDLGIGTSYEQRLGYLAERQFAGEKKAPIRLIYSGNIVFWQLVARADRGIGTPSDLRGKKVQVRRQALLALEQIFQAILKVYGIKEDELTLLEHSNTKEECESLAVGSADAGFFAMSLPHPLVAKLAQTTPCVIVPMTEDKRDLLLKEMGPAYIPGVIPAGTYKGQKQDVLGIANPLSLFSHRDVPEAIVYQLTKALNEYFDEFKLSHAQAKYWTVKNSLTSPPLPFHPGAINYFKEIGVWTPKLDQIQQTRLAEGE